MNTVELLKQVNTFLKTKADRVYYENAPENATFPYVVFNFASTFYSGPREDVSLEIDIWDDKEDTTAIENLSDNICGDSDKLDPTGLNHKNIFVAALLAATFYLDGRYSIPDDDKRIKRRQLRFRVHTY